jgi:putative membrane protein
LLQATLDEEEATDEALTKLHQSSILKMNQKKRTLNMNKIVIGTLAALLTTLSASLAQSANEKMGVNSTLGLSPATSDFIKEVAMSDMTEIAAAKIGQERGTAEDKTFAAQMISDHTKTSAELKDLVSSGSLKANLPTALDSSSQKKIDKLKNAKGEDFASDFNSMQVSAHKDAVSLFERYAKGGDNPKLKDWAGKTLPTLKHHLEMAQNLGKKT